MHSWFLFFAVLVQFLHTVHSCTRPIFINIAVSDTRFCQNLQCKISVIMSSTMYFVNSIWFQVKDPVWLPITWLQQGKPNRSNFVIYLSYRSPWLYPKSRATPVCTHHGYRVHPGIQHVTGHSEVRLSELIFLGPPEGSVAHALLDDGMEPSQKEVQASSFVGCLKTITGWSHTVKQRISKLGYQGHRTAIKAHTKFSKDCLRETDDSP